MTSPQGAFGYETLSVAKGMITKSVVIIHKTIYSRTIHKTYLHKTKHSNNIKQYNI